MNIAQIFQKRSRTPTVLQMEAMECGAAALASILGFYGRWVSLSELRLACGVSRDGVKISNITKAAKSYGLETKAYRANVDKTLDSPFPIMVFWNFNHFLIIEQVIAEKIYLNDPAIGPRVVDRTEFEKCYSGIMVEFSPNKEFKKGGERQKLSHLFLQLLNGSRLVFSLVCLISLMLIVPGIIVPAFLKIFIDDILIKGYNQWIIPILAGLLLAALLNSILTYLQQKYLLRMQVKLALVTASRFFWHVLHVPMSFYSQRSVGDIAERVQTCHRIAGLLSGPLITHFINVIMVVFFLAVMASYSLPLTVLSFLLACLNIVLIIIMQRKIKDNNSYHVNQQAKTMAVALGGIQAIETLKSTGTESDFFNLWAGYQATALSSNQRLEKAIAFYDAFPNVINHLITALVLAAGGLLIIYGHLTIGGLIAYQSILQHFIGPTKQLVNFISQINRIDADAARLNDVLQYPKDKTVSESQLETETNFEKLNGYLTLKNISFSYSPFTPPLLENFTLAIKPGMRVALVGSTGSGKSTLVNLILGLLTPTSGEIFYDEKTRSQYNRLVFSQSVVSVDQEIYLFEGTVRENLTMGNNEVSFKEMIQAAKDACIHNTIAALPAGYDSLIKEEQSNFSGGEAQRLEIARALLMNPSILVLDEATSALDALTEEEIDKNIRKRGCSCIIIAHRLSTIRDCDEIIVLDDGKIIERGQHESLMARNSLYRDLITA